MSDNVWKELRKSFAPDEIDTIPKGGAQLSYVSHARTTDRINTVCPGDWSWDFVAKDERGYPILDYDEASGTPIGLWIYLTVNGSTIPAYGSCVPKKNEAIKELIGDAIRNGAMRFGVAVDLWMKDLPEGGKASRSPAKPKPAPRRPPPVDTADPTEANFTTVKEALASEGMLGKVSQDEANDLIEVIHALPSELQEDLRGIRRAKGFPADLSTYTREQFDEMTALVQTYADMTNEA